MGDEHAAATAAEQIPSPEGKGQPETNQATSVEMEPAAPDVGDDNQMDAAMAVASENGNHNATATDAVATEPTPDAPASEEDTAGDKPAGSEATITQEEKVEGEASVAEEKEEEPNAGAKVATDAPQPVSNKEVKAAAHLSAPVRARLDEVLHSAEDKAMLEDARLINFLSEVEESQALAALNEYHSAVSETSVTIRNKPAYLMGILRKYKQAQRPPNGVEAWATNAAGVRMAMGPNGLSPTLKARLQELYEKDFLKEEDVDQRCLDVFKELTEPQASTAMDEFAQSDIDSIRNKSAFLMSILRKTHESAKKAAMQLASMYGPPAAFAGSPMMGYGAGFMDPHMLGHAPYADFYGTGAYGHHPHHPHPHHPAYNAYGHPLPMPHYLAHMPIYGHHSKDTLAPSVQYRLDRLCATGFCKANEIDERCRKFMREVPEPVALGAIEEFSMVDRSNIRKVSAYFMGVIRKHADNFKGAEAGAGAQMSMGMGAMGAMGMMPPGMMPMPGYGVGMKRGRESEGPYIPNKMQHRPRSMGGAATGDAMERLATAPAGVQGAVRDLILSGVVSDIDLDDRVTSAILQLTEEQGVAALEEFSQVDVSRIRNKSAYLMGLLKRYRTGAPPPPGLGQDRT